MDAFGRFSFEADPDASGRSGQCRRWLQTALGTVACLAFVGQIHVLFWTKFLPAYAETQPHKTILFASRFVVTPGYIALFDWTGSVTPAFVIHVLSDICLVVGGRYDLVPRLFTPGKAFGRNATNITWQ